jgi:hypothetical protein
LNPVWWTPARCEALERANPTAYRTDVLGEFADPESGLLNPAAVHRSVRETPLELAPSACKQWHAAVDPSEGGAGGNGFSLCIVGTEELPRSPGEPTQNRFRVALVREWRGMSPRECWREIAKVCAAYGLRSARTDQYAASANRDLARLYGLELVVDKATATSKLEDFTNLATLMHTDRIELSPDPMLRRDLLSVKRRTTQQGSTIVLPKTGNGRHADMASALCAALKSGGFGAPGLWMDDEWLERGEDLPDLRFAADYSEFGARW